MTKRIKGNRKVGKRGKLAVAADPGYNALLLRITEGSTQEMQMFQSLTEEQQVTAIGFLNLLTNALHMTAGRLLAMVRANEIYDTAMKRGPKIRRGKTLVVKKGRVKERR